MGFSYHNCDGSQDSIDFPRVLTSDTTQFGPDGTTPIYIFEDSEISGFTRITQSIAQSGQRYSGTNYNTLPSAPVSYYRIAANMLFSLAANKARLASIKQLLDVKLDSSDAAIQLRETAQSYLDLDDNSGAFAIAEQVTNSWTFRERFFAEIQRAVPL